MIDASNTIVIPGFVDAHRHSWEGQLRRINPECADARGLFGGDASVLRQATTGRRTCMSAISSPRWAASMPASPASSTIRTTARSAAHSDEAIRALIDSGIRAVHASGAPQAGDWDQQWPQDLDAPAEEISSPRPTSSSPCACSAGPDREQLGAGPPARPPHHHRVPAAATAEVIEPFCDRQAAGSRQHLQPLRRAAGRARGSTSSDAGVTVNVCPRSDSQYGLGEGISAYQQALDHGIKPGFSIDNETSYGTDMFMEMRVAFHIQRAMATEPQVSTATPSARAGLRCATCSNARR